MANDTWSDISARVDETEVTSSDKWYIPKEKYPIVDMRDWSTLKDYTLDEFVEKVQSFHNLTWKEEYHKGFAKPLKIISDVFPGSEGAMEYITTSSLSLQRSSMIPQHKVDANFEIADHVSINAATISAVIIMIRSLPMQEDLETLFNKRTPFTIDCSLGYFENMLILNMTFTEMKYTNTFECNITFQEVRVAKSAIINAEDVINPGIIIIPPSPGPTPSTNLSLPDKTGLDKLFI